MMFDNNKKVMGIFIKGFKTQEAAVHRFATIFRNHTEIKIFHTHLYIVNLVRRK